MKQKKKKLDLVAFHSYLLVLPAVAVEYTDSTSEEG